MSRTKYLKFGARADKNLSDLTNPVEALNNILDDISSELDENGNKLQFSIQDISGLIDLVNTGMGQSVDPETGRPFLLNSLAGTNLQATDVSNTLVDVSPKVTYQDYINNYRAVLGNPLWTAGGSGPAATFIPSDRLNANTTDNIGSIIACDPGDTQGGGAQDLTVGNRYRIESLLTINQNGWNEIAGTVGVTYAIGSIFTCAVTVSDAIGDGNHNSAACKNVTLPTGNSGTTDANALTSNQLFTTKVDTSLTDIVGPEDFWTNGDFRFSYKVNSDFPDSEGGIQWEGYQSGRFNVGFRTTAYFLIEEDVNNDNNWTTLKAVTEDEYETAYPITWADSGDVTEIKFYSRHDYARVCEGMTIELNQVSQQVVKVYRKYNTTSSEYEYYATLDGNVGNEDSTGSIQTFVTDVNQEQLDSGTVTLTPVARGNRRHVRYTAFWRPRPANDSIDSKYFNEYDPSEGGTLSFNYFYPDDGSTDVDGQYTFKYFFDNRVNFTQQKTSTNLNVNNTISLEYSPPQVATDVFTEYSSKSIVRKQVQIQDISGSIIGEDVESTIFSDIDVGDWIVVCLNSTSVTRGNTNGVYYAYQVLEKVQSKQIYVHESYTTLGINEHVLHDVLFVKNKGLKGIYQSSPLLIGGNLEKKQVLANVTSNASSMNRPYATYLESGDIGYKVEYDLLTASSNHTAHTYPFRLTTFVPAATTALSTWEPHPSAVVTAGDGTATTLNSEDFGTSPAGGQNGLMMVYSSKGLQDSSAKHECGGVYGLEVVTPPGGAPAGSNDSGSTRIYVKELDGAEDQTGYYVYFAGSDPAAPVIDQHSVGGVSTTIASHSADGASDPYINISTVLNADIAPGTTIVLVPDTSYNSVSAELQKNREYCIIPLNTAPPFASTLNGLATTATFDNLMVSGLEFEDVEVFLADSKVVDLETVTWAGDGVPDKNVDILGPNDTGAGSSTYKILINSDTYS